MSARIVIVYGSTDGQTAKIASRIAGTLRGRGHPVDLADVRGAPPSLDGAGAVLVGASLRYGHYQHAVEKFVQRNRAALEALPNAFIAVSLSAARPNPRAQAEVQHSIDRFVQKTGWTPRQRVPLAGAVTWTRYGWFTRLIMLLLLKMLGAPETDTSRDYELTDWTAVRTFAEEFSASLEQRPRLHAVQ